MKALKRFLLILLSVMTFTLVGATMASCNDEPETVTYTVEVVDENDAPVQGAFVIFCIPGQNCLNPITTDATGKVVTEKDAHTWEVHATFNGKESETATVTAESQTIKLILNKTIA